jgi:hypothetical protein
MITYVIINAEQILLVLGILFVVLIIKLGEQYNVSVQIITMRDGLVVDKDLRKKVVAQTHVNKIQIRVEMIGVNYALLLSLKMTLSIHVYHLLHLDLLHLHLHLLHKRQIDPPLVQDHIVLLVVSLILLCPLPY